MLPMFRVKLMGALCVVLSWASLALSQEPPPLEGPVSDADPPKAAALPQTPAATGTATPAKPPVPPTPPSSTGSQVRPMLVIPGVTAPAARAGSLARPVIPSPSRSPGVSLTGPRGPSSAPAPASGPEIGSPFRRESGRTVQSHPDPSARPSIPLTIEPLEDDSPADRQRPRTTPAAGAAIRPRAGGPRPGVRSSASSDPSDPSGNSSSQRSSARRMPGLLGRLLGQPVPQPSRPAARSEPADRKSDREPLSGAETDAAVKRKIEKQIQESLGDRVKSVEVRVSGRNVLIVAKATRFWQKRPVRRSLETLPVLSGFRPRIELED